MRKLVIIFFWGIIHYSYSQTPEFVIQTISGGWHHYTTSLVNDTVITASITSIGDIWTLDITVNTSIDKVIFPYESQRNSLDSDITDDIVYYPFLAGVTEKATNLNVDFNWWGEVYPGKFFAPLIIVGDQNNGRIVAATNWPAKQVTPNFAAERIMLVYDNQNLQINDVESYSALIRNVSADPSQGEKPWRLALDEYKNWLYSNINPPIYSTELQNVHGYFFVGLMNWPSFDLPEINSVWTQWRDKLPWIQLWGQMSNYAGPPQFAVPPLLPEEVTDCCLLEYNMHTRYIPSLATFMQDSVVNLGYYGGYYSSAFKSFSPPSVLLLDTPAGQDWLLDWIEKNELDYNANAFYLDIIGREYWGKPNSVMNLLSQIYQDKPMTIIEGMVDIYPASGLLSGSLVGASIFVGREGLTPENTTATTFPNLQRYLLNDRIVFLGPSNGDSGFMGPNADYWLERQTFLLGAKFEVSHPNDNWNPSTPNPILTLAINERDNVNWWQRNPLYQDTKGITNVPNDIEIRRFIDNSACELFVIDNWNEFSGQSFNFNGQSYSISSSKLSIIDDCVLSVNEQKNILIDYNLYPNPAKNTTTIVADITLNNATIKILNNLGQSIMFLDEINGNTYDISLKNINSGIYFIQLINDNNYYKIKKIIIAN